MTKKALTEIRKGRKVYANYPLKGAERYRHIEEVLDVREGLVLMDEAGLIAPAAFWNKIPYEYLASWRQHRKNGLDIWYTAQDLQDVATPLRRVTQFAHDAQRMYKWIYYRTYNPRSKAKFGWGLSYVSPKVFDHYDTFFEVEKPKYLQKE
jgi:hypothetical protein